MASRLMWRAGQLTQDGRLNRLYNQITLRYLYAGLTGITKSEIKHLINNKDPFSEHCLPLFHLFLAESLRLNINLLTAQNNKYPPR